MESDEQIYEPHLAYHEGAFVEMTARQVCFVIPI